MKTTPRLVAAAFGLAIFNVSAATLYVSLESSNPVPPFATWATAATNIQDAVDAAKAGDTVLVTNGVYAVGSRNLGVWRADWAPPQFESKGLSRVVATNSIKLESVNGPLLTTIEGSSGLPDETGWLTNTIRCVFLGANTVLSGFTLRNGAMIYNEGAPYGGGAYGGTLYNCTLMGNSVSGLPGKGWSGAGGAVYGATLYNCTLTGNSVWGGLGGAAFASTLYNCTVTGNSANVGGTLSSPGGGAAYSTLYNCTVTGNTATWVGGGTSYSTLYNCTLTYNSAPDGGGAFDCALYNCTVTGNSAGGYDGGGFHGYGGGAAGGALYNCIVYYNTAPNGANYFTGTTEWEEKVSTLLNYSCTTPLPTNGVGNITGPPLFMDMAAGDFRLREDSPCIDAGIDLVGVSATVTNWFGEAELIAYAHESTDILGNTRFIDGNGDGKVAWDVGAFEFNSFKPPRFNGAPQLTSDGWELNITGAPNKWVQVQRSSDLKNWEAIWPLVFMGSEGVKQIIDGDMGQRAMCYRAVVP